MANLILTGFMGTGKSTVGRMLASRLDLDFVDTDALIEDRHGPIPEIFTNQGESAFRDIEHGIATELAQRTGLVIATGGRMLLDERNAAALDATGDIFCLTASADELIDRLLGDRNEHTKRPLLDADDPRQRIVDLLVERAEGYSQFPQIETTGRPVEEIVQHVVDQLR